MIKTHLIELNEIYVATMADADRLEIALNQVSDKLGEEWRTVQLTSVCVWRPVRDGGRPMRVVVLRYRPVAQHQRRVLTRLRGAL